jgi:hypothetical protein
MDQLGFSAIVNNLNSAEMPTERIAAHRAAVAANNHQVATAALARLGVDRPPVSFDTLRVAHLGGDGGK